MMWGYGGGLGLGGLLGMIGMIALVIGVIVLIVWLVTRTASTGTAQGPAPRLVGQDASELLRMRFARGEITEDEYRAAKKVLEEGR
ncbi:MAG TPA: SHOCT domain-containing protein [Candidatus Limnocylindrales bacterium]